MRKYLLLCMLAALLLLSFPGQEALATEPLSVVVTLDKQTVDISKGETITANWEVTGGSGTLLYQHYYWSIAEDDAGAGYEPKFGEDTGARSDSLKPVSGVKGVFTVYLEDTEGNYGDDSGTFTLSGGPEPMILTVTLDKPSVAAGERIVADCNVNGGTAPFRYNFDWMVKDEHGVSHHLYSDYEVTNDSTSFAPTFGVEGEVNVGVTDATGRGASVRKTFGITGGQTTDPLGLVINLDKTSVAVGQTITANWQATGGTPPYTYNYDWWVIGADGKDNYIYGAYEVASLSDSFRPGFGVEGAVSVNVRDSLGRNFYDEKRFEVTGEVTVAPLTLEVNLDKTSVAIDQGQTITGTWSAAGGTGPYTFDYHWSVQANDSGGSVGDRGAYEVMSTSDTFAPKYGVAGSLEVTVRDSQGRRTDVTKSFKLTGAVPAAPLVISIDLDKSTAAVGDTITANWSPSGGTAPYTINYHWIMEDAGGVMVGRSGETDALQDQFTPKTGGKGRLYVTVEDSLGRTAYANSEFTVTGEATVQPLKVILSLDKTSVDASKGDTITATWTAEGGAGGYSYDITWYVSTLAQSTSGGESVRNSEKITQTSDSLKVTFGARGRASVTVYDKDGREAYAYESFEIAEATAGYLPGDANNDNRVTLSDLEALVDFLVAEKAPASMKNADANALDGVTADDAIWLANRLAY